MLDTSTIACTTLSQHRQHHHQHQYLYHHHQDHRPIYININIITKRHYLTEPVMPATKCFCMRKNTSAVGSVAIVMTVIISP